eukprot:1019561-Amphidinium_carterae.1
MPSFGQSSATLCGLKGFHHTLAVTNNTAGLAFLQSLRNSQEFSSRVSDVANPTSTEVWVATVSARSIGPD